MADQSESDAVWAETEDGGLLHQLFGFYPTLHDATVRTITYHRDGDRLEMVVDYEDEAEGDTPLRARISLTWTGVDRATLGLTDNFVSGLHFKRQGDRIVTHLKTMDQTDGTVVADHLEARIVSLDPAPDTAPPPILFTLE